MVRLLRGLGTFGQVGAITAIAMFLMVLLSEIVFLYLLPWALSALGQIQGGSVSEEKTSELSEIIRTVYALSWFGGAAAAYKTLFPSELDLILEKSMSGTSDDDVTGNDRVQRFILLLLGPWWILVGYLSADAYFGGVPRSMLGYNFDGSMTLFVLSGFTIAIPIIARVFLDAALWVRTGG